MENNPSQGTANLSDNNANPPENNIPANPPTDSANRAAPEKIASPDPNQGNFDSILGQNPTQTTPIETNGQTSPLAEEPTAIEPKTSDGPTVAKADFQEEKTSRRSVVNYLIIIAVVVFGLWYFNRDQGQIAGTKNENSDVTINVEDKKEEGEVKIIGADNAAAPIANGEKVRVTTYYGRVDNDGDCLQVSALTREFEKKYDSLIVNTVRALIAPLTAEGKSAGLTSSIPAGTYLKNIRIVDGLAEVRFSSTLGQVADSCAAAGARAQIENTLLQFNGVNSVKICIEDECDQSKVLQ